MNCACGGFFDAGVCVDCGEPDESLSLLTAKQIIQALRAHKRAGHDEVLEAVLSELGGIREVIREVIVKVPIETRTIETIEHQECKIKKQGKPPKVSFDCLVRARAMLRNGFDRKEVASILEISERTLLDYVAADGALKAPALERLKGSSAVKRRKK